MAYERGDDRLHGIEVSRRRTDGLGASQASEVWIRRVSVRYEDGRVMSFIPEAEQEYLVARRERLLLRAARDRDKVGGRANKL